MSRSALVLVTLLAVSCRAGKGEDCLCAADCKAGLVCALEGTVLEGNECTPGGPADAGTCVPSDDVPMDSAGGLETTGPYMDLGSKKDFEPDPPPPPTTGATTGTTATSSSTGPGTGSTGAPTTGGSDTGTSTSTSG